MLEVCVARQPIYRRDLSVYGYELLFREEDLQRAQFEDGELASAQVIINTCINIGLEHLVGGHYAFINLPRSLLASSEPLPMSTEQVVLEVLEDVPPDAQVLKGLDRLRRQGYRIALDDFRYCPTRTGLLERADLVKLDLQAIPPGELEAEIAQIRPFGVALLAEKAETRAAFEQAERLGFDYFQGFFFCRPDVVRRRTPAADKLTVLRLLERLQDPRARLEELERLLVQDVTLAYKLLRYVNCARFARRREITSVRDALQLAGTEAVRGWTALILLSRLSSDKPNELLTTALVRARMAELLAPSAGVTQGPMFTVGLFSVLDALMDRPMRELVEAAGFAPAIQAALAEHGGEMGALLTQVLRYEAGDWGGLALSRIPAPRFSQAYLEGVQWAEDTRRLLEGD